MGLESFISDNALGMHLSVLKALEACNTRTCMPYGDDDLTKEAQNIIRDIFQAPDALFFPVTTGTAANALAIASIVPSFGSILCHKNAHICTSECGSPEFFTHGAKQVTFDGVNGKISNHDIMLHMEEYRATSNIITPTPNAISVTNATEIGTVYSEDEVCNLCCAAHKNQLHVHIDGARLANALVATHSTPANMITLNKVDVLSFGLTKNGGMCTEAIIFLNTTLAENFKRRLKQAGHVVSKNRFLSAQWLALLQKDLWLQLAQHANNLALILGEKITKTIPTIELATPIVTNAVFLKVPSKILKKAYGRGLAFYRWPTLSKLSNSKKETKEEEETVTIRLMTNFTTSMEDINLLIKALL